MIDVLSYGMNVRELKQQGCTASLTNCSDSEADEVYAINDVPSLIVHIEDDS